MATIPRAKGRDVVDSVVRTIVQSGVFRDDHGFLKRIAYVESKFGEDPGTYRAGYDGGIWQVDRIGFEDTKNVRSHPSLRNLHAQISQKLNIQWADVAWNDLLKPLYSGLAARLFLSLVPAAIPTTLEDQGRYWKNHYNKTGSGTPDKFVRDVRALEG